MATKTAMHKLRDRLDQHLSKKRVWWNETKRLRLSRLGERKKRTLYPNAPNFLEPIIDDNVTAITAQEMQIQFSTRYFAHFVPLSEDAGNMKRQAEIAFDTLLRFTTKFRAKTAMLMDMKNQDGFAVAKLVPNKTAYPEKYGIEGTIPDFDVVDPLDMIVPTNCSDLEKAPEFAQIIRYTEPVYMALAKERKWKNAQAVWNQAKKETRDGTDDRSGVQLTVGLNHVDPSSDEIVLWEVYHSVGRQRKVTLLCPDVPDAVLESYEWKWPDNIEFDLSMTPSSVDADVKVTKAHQRRWPFFQFRHEDRSMNWYDTRGVAVKLEDNQKAATQLHNIRGVHWDFFGNPILESGGSTGGLSKFRWRPGDVMPKGMKPAQLPKLDSALAVSIDEFRAAAQRRAGSSQGALSSIINQGRDRKTATEVNQETINSNQMTSDSIMRFAEPYGELFAEMWKFLQHNPVELPMVNTNDMTSAPADKGILQLPFLVLPAASSRHADPQFMLSQLTQLQPYFQNNPHIKPVELTRFAFDMMDPRMTDQIVIDEESETALEQQVQQLAQMMEQMGQQIQAINGFVMAQIQEDEADEARQQAIETFGGGNGSAGAPAEARLAG